MCLFFPPAERPDCPVRHPQCVCCGCPGLLTPAVPSRGGSERPRSDQWNVQHHLLQKGYFFSTIHWHQNRITVWGQCFAHARPVWLDFFFLGPRHRSTAKCFRSEKVQQIFSCWFQGAAVLRMLSDFLTEPVFAKGLSVSNSVISHVWSKHSWLDSLRREFTGAKSGNSVLIDTVFWCFLLSVLPEHFCI